MSYLLSQYIAGDDLRKVRCVITQPKIKEVRKDNETMNV